MIFKLLKNLLGLDRDFSLPCYDRSNLGYHVEPVEGSNTLYDLSTNNGDGTVTIERVVVVGKGRTHRIQ